MPLSRQTFSGVNTDDADQVRPASNFIAATNIMLEPGQIYPITGNVLVDGYVLPATGENISRGCFADGATGTGVELLYNSAGYHRLIRYDPTGNAGAGSRTTLLEWAGLNLAPDLTLQGGVLDDIVVYRDAAGEMRAINLLRAAQGVYTPAYLAAEPFALYLVKVPPTTALLTNRVLDNGVSPAESLRIIQSRAYQFSYRYRYVDGEVTCLATFTNWLDVLSDPTTAGELVFNAIVLTLPAAVPAGVLEVELLVREAGTNIWQVADTLQRVAGVLPTFYHFYGQLLGGAVPDDESDRPFEALWPCDTAAIARNRVEVAGLHEGYPTPTPAFTAVVQTGNSGNTSGTLYMFQYVVRIAGEPGEPDAYSTIGSAYALNSGTYPDPASTYVGVDIIPDGANPGALLYRKTGQQFSYDEAFNPPPYPDEQSRTVLTQNVTYVTKFDNANQSTFHERSSYRVTVQYFDALGRAGGCCAPVTVSIPAQSPTAGFAYRSILASFTTTDLAQLNAEIPAWAYSCQFLVARNDRTTYFLQGRAADVLGYLGHKTVINDTNGDVDQIEQTVDVIHTPHEKVLVDIGNWPAMGQGYVWQLGDRITFLNENKTFDITDQRGDYLEVAWTGYPDKSIDTDGNTQARVEIFTPNTTPSAIYYERGPRIRILRTGTGENERRSYEQPSVVLDGDCFLTSLPFPFIKRGKDSDGNDFYQPVNKKEFMSGPTMPLESMVPPFRLAPVRDTVTIVHERQQRKIYDGALFGLIQNQESVNVSTTTQTVAETTNRTAASLLWLDMSYGGRPGVRIPLSLQQVNRRSLLRFSAPKQQGNLLNGLSRWDSLSQYDKLPAEQGGVTRLLLADQSQSDGSVLLAVQQYGVASLYLNQQPIQASTAGSLLAISDKFIPQDNTLRGGLGCVDPDTVVSFSGKGFWFCRERAELVRYNNNLVPLAFTYKFRNRLAELTNRYVGGRVTGCFHPRRQEYWLTFHPTEAEPTGATVVWSELREQWADSVSAIPTAGSSLGNELVTWAGGDLYRHLPTAPVGTFYGTYADCRVRFTFAQPDEAAKQWMNLEIRTNGGLWNATSLLTDTGQASRTRVEWWENREGAYRLTTGLRRNERSPGFSSLWVALDRGQPLVAPRLSVELTTPRLNPQPLTLVVASWLPRAGQGMAV